MKRYVERHASGRLLELSRLFPAVVVTGARQTGKSTLLEHGFGATAQTVVFDPVLDVGNARRDPELFLANHPPPLILDEIQYAPELVASLKRRIDRDRTPGQYLLTGSQQWGVLKTMAESLAGRAVFLDLEGFSCGELAGVPAGAMWLASWLETPGPAAARHAAPTPMPYSLYEYLWRGTLPEATQTVLAAVPAYLTAYVRTYIERDVRVLAEPADLQEFGRFFRLAAALSANEINYSELGREIGISPQTAKRWLGLLRQTFQWHEVPAFLTNRVKRVSGKTKGYLTDTGLICMAQMISSPAALSGHPITGALFETAVCAEIRRQAALLPVPPAIHHWRSAGGAEVDLVLERDNRLFPMEIKLSSAAGRRDTSGLSAFRKSYPQARIAPGLVLAPVSEMFQLTDHDYAMPWNAMMP